MKVNELIDILQGMDPDASIFIMRQMNWPFECSLAGVATRKKMLEHDGELYDEEGEECDGDDEYGTAANDVFLVEGKQIRYGSKTAWQVARR